MALAIPTTQHAGPPANDTAVTWRGCWHCGLPVFDDEGDLCPDCHSDINRIPVPRAPGDKPLAWTLRQFGPQGLGDLAAEIVEAGTRHAEEAAAAAAADLELDQQTRAAYVAGVRTRCREELARQCADGLQQIGATLGWRPAT